MRKFWWSAMVLTGATAAGVYWTTNYFAGQIPHGIRTVRGHAGDQENVVPVVILPQRPSRFQYDLVEPIQLQPEVEDFSNPNNLLAPPSAPISQSRVPARMPYADEPVTEKLEDNSVWANLIETLQNLLPGAVATEEPPVITPEELGPIPDAPNDDATQIPFHMPTVPEVDYHPHHHYPNCPHLHGFPRGYPTFPQPAYQFDRTMPRSPESTPTRQQSPQPTPTEENKPAVTETSRNNEGSKYNDFLFSFSEGSLNQVNERIKCALSFNAIDSNDKSDKPTAQVMTWFRKWFLADECGSTVRPEATPRPTPLTPVRVHGGVGP